MELQDGMPRLLIDFGSGTLELKVASRPLNDEEWHTIDVFWNPEVCWSSLQRLFILVPIEVYERQIGTSSFVITVGESSCGFL